MCVSIYNADIRQTNLVKIFILTKSLPKFKVQ